MDPDLSTIETGFAADVGAFGGGDHAPRAGDFQGMGERGRRRSGLMSATIAPTWVSPSQIAKYSGRLPITRAMVSPGAIPALQRPTRILVHARRERAEAKTLPIAHERRASP